MAEIISEKNYPVRLLWAFKYPLICFLCNFVLLIFGYINFYVLVAMIITLIYNPLARKFFHYELQDKYFLIKQGVISRKERNLPYGVIQNTFLKQDIFDRIFGLASLVVENAAGTGAKYLNTNQQSVGLGTKGNKVHIPGLKKADAEALKVLILAKMKENPLEDTRSGL